MELDELSANLQNKQISSSNTMLNKSRLSDNEKFDRLLMIAAERKNSSSSITRNRQGQKKDVPLLLIEQDQSSRMRSQQVRFSTGPGSREKFN